MIFAFPSFFYPFGRDQAAHAYIGWGWLHGFLPFRDAIDQKPPGIYLLYLLGSLFLGERQVGIRVIDLGGIILAGWLACRAARRGRPRVPGELGSVILLVTGYYYTCFDYWNSAQTEIWQGLAVLAGVVLIREARPRRAAVWSGVLGGVAVLFKFTAGIMCLGLAALLALRAWEAGGPARARAARLLRWFGLQVLGGAAVIAAFAAYFGAFGALGSAVEVLVKYNLAYGAGWRADPATARSWSADFWLRNSGLWTGMMVAGWIWAAWAASRRRDGSVREILAVPAGLLALGAVAVAIQGKFFSYHWGVLVPILGLAAAHGVAEGARSRPRIVPAAAVGAVLLGFVLSPQWICNRAADNPHPTTYLRQTGRTWSYLTGRLTRVEFLRPFDGGYGYRYADQEALGRIIRERARPGDGLIVRGFEPGVYAVSGLRSPSRFFIEVQLQEQRVSFSRQKWIDEHRQARIANPPRFVVVPINMANQLGDIGKSGYHRTETRGRLVLYERNAEAGPTAAPVLP